jgi:hypothetical protein
MDAMRAALASNRASHAAKFVTGVRSQERDKALKISASAKRSLSKRPFDE